MTGGLSLPQEFGLGVAVRPVERLLVSAEVNWIDWSGALKTSTLRASNPDNPAAPPNLDLPSTHNWRDQYVIAIGLAYDLTPKTTLTPTPNSPLTRVRRRRMNISRAISW